MTFYLILPHKVTLELIRVSTFSDISASPFGVYSPKLHVYIASKELVYLPSFSSCQEGEGGKIEGSSISFM